MSKPILCSVMLLALLPVLWTGRQYALQRTDAQVALTQFQAISAQTTELAKLKAAAPPEARRGRPPTGIASRLAGVIALAGLPQGSLQNVTPELESIVSSAVGAGYPRTTVRLTLEPITLPELGRFLNEWRTAEPVWTVTTLDLTPTNRATQDQQRPLRAALVIETLFADDTQPKGNH